MISALKPFIPSGEDFVTAKAIRQVADSVIIPHEHKRADGSPQPGARAMTEALRKAFEAASRLPNREQDELAAAILEELKADECWEAMLARSQRELERLAEEAIQEHRAGRTEALDPDAL